MKNAKRYNRERKTDIYIFIDLQFEIKHRGLGLKHIPATSPAPYRIYNIGNQHPTRLMDYIHCIEKSIGREAKKEYLPMQPGDVYQTYADSSALAAATGFKPGTDLQEGIDRTVSWFKHYYNL